MGRVGKASPEMDGNWSSQVGGEGMMGGEERDCGCFASLKTLRAHLTEGAVETTGHPLNLRVSHPSLICKIGRRLPYSNGLSQVVFMVLIVTSVHLAEKNSTRISSPPFCLVSLWPRNEHEAQGVDLPLLWARPHWPLSSSNTGIGNKEPGTGPLQSAPWQMTGWGTQECWSTRDSGAFPLPSTEPGRVEMTNKPVLPSSTPRPTSAPSRHRCWAVAPQPGAVLSKEVTLRLRSE